MSLLTQFDHVSATEPCYIQNIGSVAAPCIAGDAVGAVRIAEPQTGLLLQSDPATSIYRIRGGAASAGEVRLGSSAASFQNVVMTDGLTAVNTTLNVYSPLAVFDDVYLNGSLILSGGASGESISGYYGATSPFVAGGGAVANPAGLTPGLYSVIAIPTGAGNENAQASAICFWSGSVWTGNGVSFNFTGGAPNLAIGPVAGGATLNLGGATIGALSGTVVFRKLLN